MADFTSFAAFPYFLKSAFFPRTFEKFFAASSPA